MRAIPILLLFAACTGDDSLCDHDQKYLYGLCYEVNAQVDAGTDMAHAHFGDPCAIDDDCAAPANYCAIESGEVSGYCSHTNCLDVDGVCPPTWTCLDLGVYQPEFSICKQP